MSWERCWLATLSTLSVAGCLVSFDDYPLATGDAGVGASAGSAGSGGAGGSAGSSGGSGGVGASGGAAGDAGLDGSSASGGGGSGGGADAAGCLNGLVPVSDDFEDGNLADDPDWILFLLGVSASESSGNLLLGWPSLSEADWAGGISSSAQLDFTNCAAHVEVLQLPAQNSGAYVRFGIEVSQGNSLDVIAADGVLYAQKNVGGNKTSSTLPYNATEHRWWRLREAGGTFHWEVSKDAIGWMQLATPEVTPLDVSSARLVVGGGTTQSGSNAGSARLDNVNRGP